MPKVQLIFILHVSTYRSVFPPASASLLVRVLSRELSCVWARNGHLLSRSLARWIQRREKPDFPRTDLRARVVQSSPVPRSGGSARRVLYRVRVCLQLRPWAVGRLWERCPEGARRQRGPSRLCLLLPCCGTLTAGPLPFAHHSGSRTNAHSGGFLFFFLCSLWSFGFHASRESERGVCGYDLNLFACF